MSAILSSAAAAEPTNSGRARLPTSAPRPDAELIAQAVLLADEGQVDAAAGKLLSRINEEKEAPRRALLRLALGHVLYRAQRDADAEREFSLALNEGIRVPDIVHYHLGVLKQRLKKDSEALAHFEAVVRLRSSQATEQDALYQMAHIQLARENWREAIALLEQLRRRFKNDPRYPEVLFQLLRAEVKAGRRGGSICLRAREIFAKHPAPAAVTPEMAELATWGPRLEKNSVAGQTLACTASQKDLRTRIRRLWLAGEEKRAEVELKSLRDETDEDGYSLVDSLLVGYLVGEGRVDEALKILMAKYEAYSSRPAFLLLLGKTASAAGEYQMAIAAYQRAYDLAPRGKNGVFALFQSAFTSYQIQDYDGASRRFSQLVRSGAKSRFVREAQWYMAWIRYLRGDYSGAYESFQNLAGASSTSSHRRRPARVATDAQTRDRLRYWSAMSLYKQGRVAESLPLFRSLVRDPSIGYYALLAYSRLLSIGSSNIPNSKIPAGVEARLGLKREEVAAISEAEITDAAVTSAVDAHAEFADDLNSSTANLAANEEGDVLADDSGAEAGAMGEGLENGEDEQGLVIGTLADGAYPNFKDPSLAQKFERVRDLALAGFASYARRELREIEKRARSNSDRRLLMSEYALVKSYERSSYIAEVGFGFLRLRTGLRGESRAYWEYAYPRAYEKAVREAAKSTAVPEELIWSIMRAESHFRYDAQSPVGALGLMQLMPFTSRKVADLMNLREFETRNLLVPETNIRLGARYLQRLFEKFSGQLPLIAASYNAGPHRVTAWVRNFGRLNVDEFIEHIPFFETRNYVKRVMRNHQIYTLLYQSNPKLMNGLIEPVGAFSDATPTRIEIW